MKELKKELMAVSKSLKQLTHKTEQIAKKMDRLDRAPVAKRSKAKAKAKPVKKAAAKKALKANAIDIVFNIIKKRKKGIDAATLKKRTGFNDKKVWNTINMLKMKGKVKSAKRGVYVKI